MSEMSEKYRMSKAQARKVVAKLRAAHSQIYKSVESIGVDYYGLVRWYKEEEQFWSAQTKAITLLANKIKQRYRIEN